MERPGDVMFGDPDDFAVEAGPEPDLTEPSAVWGQMRVWCGGTPLGDFDARYCALYPAYGSFEWLAAHVGELWDESLAGLSDPELWALLRGALYGAHGNGISVPKPVAVPDDSQAAAAWKRYEKFEFLTNWGEQFDGFPAFLLSPPGSRCRVLFQSPGTGEPVGVVVSRVGVVSASEAFVAWFERQERLLSGETA